MFPNNFAYRAPETLEEALDLLEANPWDGKLLAGGHSLLPMMKLRMAAPELLIDINKIEELKGISEQDGYLRIGALTHHSDLERNLQLVPVYPLLARTARWIADPSIRNRGTVAGSLVHADPASDWGTTMLALHAEVEVASKSGRRRIAIDDFFVDTFTTALNEGELVSAVYVPTPTGEPHARYMKLERKAGDFAIVGLALQVETDMNGVVSQAGIGICACGPTPLRAVEAEQALVGQSLTADVIKHVSGLVSHSAEPTSDLRGTAEYKRDLLRVFARRALTEIRAEQSGEERVS
ncbi:FAD binding domain-containing protein [Alicyclobacillus sp. ALC3]|uniref:FAD binding domain-containing protein n=1 Tax=Alicyclobacillus sp. ALC3 TaxID=2796143 RepID=UPI002379CAE9|nr:xanthine dehydrogenase family protein subunit M [Alicyclobacillus sp. ALC3]WDL96269.1 xanthine dehydrogenase family protein subunit M [Alicyclobacillus sp. ALC3]